MKNTNNTTDNTTITTPSEPNASNNNDDDANENWKYPDLGNVSVNQLSKELIQAHDCLRFGYGDAAQLRHLITEFTFLQGKIAARNQERKAKM